MKVTIWICFLAASAAVGAFIQENSSISREVHEIYLEDQKDRGVGGESLPWDKIEQRDRVRRMRIHELLAAGPLQTAEDFHDAAFIYQHGQTPDDYLLAHVLATVAVQKGDSKSLWISAATLDRYLSSISQSQVFGTQYNSKDDSPVTQEPYNRMLIPDHLRADFCVPSLDQQQKNLAEFKAGRYPAGILPPGCTR
jgi:hypothetical protein